MGGKPYKPSASSASDPAPPLPEAPPVAVPPKVRRDLTEGSLFSHLIRLAIPSSLTTALHMSYHAVDMYFIAHIPLIGTQALAAMAVFGYFFMLFIVFNQIVGIGSVALIARTYGAKDYDDCKTVIGQTFVFKLLLAVITAVLGLMFTRWFYLAFGSTAEVADLGTAYASIFFLGLPLFFSGFTLNTAFKGIGDMMKPLYITLVAVGINLVLDWALIFGHLGLPAMGIRGAALASVIGQAWTLAAGLYIFLSGRTFVRLEARHFFRLSWSWIWRILRIGTPAAIAENVRQFGQFAIARVINSFGTAVMAAHGIMWPVMNLFWVPQAGLTEATITLVGQNLGAKRPERSERTVWLALGVALGAVALLAVPVFIFAPQLVRIYSADPEVVRYGVVFVRILVGAVFFINTSMTIASAYWGSGDTKPPMYVAIATTWLVNVPLAFAAVYALKLPVFSIYWIMLGTEALNLAAFWLLFRRGRWKKVRV